MEEIPSICGFCFVVWNGSGLGPIRARFNTCGHSAAPSLFAITNSIPLLNQWGLEPITDWFGKASSSLQSDTRDYVKSGFSMSMELCLRFKDARTDVCGDVLLINAASEWLTLVPIPHSNNIKVIFLCFLMKMWMVFPCIKLNMSNSDVVFYLFYIWRLALW